MNLQGRLDKLERALPPSPVADPYDPSDILLMLSDPEARHLSCEQIEAIERPKAEERARKRTDLMQPDCQETFLAEAGQTRDAVARAVGGMSGRTYEKAKVVVGATEAEYLSCKAALDARQAELDAGGGACESTLAT